jgi:hypothetical protein
MPIDSEWCHSIGDEMVLGLGSISMKIKPTMNCVGVGHSVSYKSFILHRSLPMEHFFLSFERVPVIPSAAIWPLPQ